MKEIMDELLSGLSELVYIADIETYELLYLNESGRDLFGHDVVNKGLPCYRVLQGREEPCPFCTNHLLSVDSFYQWEHTNEKTLQHYLLRDKLFWWQDKVVRLEIAFDITTQIKERASYRFLAEAGNLAVDGIKVLESGVNFEEALDEVLSLLGKFLDANRTYVCKIENDTIINTYEWCKPGVGSQVSTLENLPMSSVPHWQSRFLEGQAVIVEEVSTLDLGRVRERDLLAYQDISSVIAVPLTIDGKLVGFLGADDPSCEGLAGIETPLVGLAHFVAASMKREMTQRKVEELTWRDSLTHVKSRAAFHRDFDQGLFEKVGFILVDADRLSIINREQGRAMGDETLCRIAACLAKTFGEGVYRIGDDEFCAVVTSIGYAEFAGLAERAAKSLRDEGLPASLGPSWSERCADTVNLLDVAGDRMRSAKRGRHRAVDLGIDLASDAAVSNLLRAGGAQEAVESGLFTIFLMPQSCGLTGEIIGAEALIRYRNQEKQMQALPSSFIPALEDMGEISAIDFFALSKACETLARWQQEGREVIPLSVNFSRRTIGEQGFVGRVVATVGAYGVDAALIEVEITESAREDSDSMLRSISDDLRKNGFCVAIDDFGVENANFSLFIQLTFDVLKIDKSLVWGLGSEDHTMQVIRGLVTLCDDLGIETVAEGIETEEQYNALRDAGCTRAQGYRVGKPCSIDQFEQRFLV